MADTKTTALTEITAPVSTDLVYIVGDPGTTPVSRKATLTTLRKTLMVDGWIEAGATWTYASADGPTGVITVPSDATTKYSVGMRVKLTQTTIKYFIITAIAATSMTVYGGTDYTLANAAISANYYSMAKAPFGFPQDPAKWTVKVTDATNPSQNTPTQNVWYNLGTISITIPIGIWRVSYQACPQIDRTGNGTGTIETTLSTANNSESDTEMTTYLLLTNGTNLAASMDRRKPSSLVLAAKTVYYLNARTTLASMATLELGGDKSMTTIEAVCAYL